MATWDIAAISPGMIMSPSRQPVWAVLDTSPWRMYHPASMAGLRTHTMRWIRPTGASGVAGWPS